MPEIPYTIVPAQPKHARQIAALYKRTWAEVVHLLGEKLTKHRQASIRTVSQWLHDNPYFVAIYNRQVIGVAGAEPCHGTVHMVHMVVDRQYQKHGIGTALVKKVEEFAHEVNAVKVWFDTHPGLDDAIRLYESLGYQRCGSFKKHYWGIDIVLYEKLL